MNDSEKSPATSSPVTRRKFLQHSAMGAALPALCSVTPSVFASSLQPSLAQQTSKTQGASGAQPSNGVRRPTILWICTDQQRFDTIRALGNHNIRTPNLDRLAASGVAFANTYCQAPVCTPSRAPNDMFRLVSKGQSLYPLLTGKTTQEVKNNLMFQLFDALQLATDPGQPRIASF